MSRTLWLLPLILLLPACAELGYYAQAVNGQLWLLSARTPIELIIEDPAVPERRRGRLRTALEARGFASRELALPDNGSYRQFADLQRPYAVWNVIATPPLSISPRQSCFPVTGCLSYRGWFSRERAEAYAELRREQGDDVFSGPVDAYSTLGWFDDPLLNTMLTWDEADMVAMVFHELAHQRVYIADDSAFNESYATAVEQAGMRRWLGDTNPLAFTDWVARKRQAEAVRTLLIQTRDALGAVYAADVDADTKRIAKRDLLDHARARYRESRAANGWDRRYDAWFGERLNNALLSAIDTYHRWVPAFEAILATHNGNFSDFHAEVARIGTLSRRNRDAVLQRYIDQLDRTAQH
ncbi:MAG: aminopeptidase [Gammaproteobacteria bacterium]|nr:aminopeptidase [Gammaproteobacteria bacterium]